MSQILECRAAASQLKTFFVRILKLYIFQLTLLLLFYLVFLGFNFLKSPSASSCVSAFSLLYAHPLLSHSFQCRPLWTTSSLPIFAKFSVSPLSPLNLLHLCSFTLLINFMIFSTWIVLLTFKHLSYPVLTWPVLTWPVLTWLVLTCPSDKSRHLTYHLDIQ